MGAVLKYDVGVEGAGSAKGTPKADPADNVVGANDPGEGAWADAQAPEAGALPPEPGLPPHAPPPPAAPPPLAPPPTALPFPAEGQAPALAAAKPQPEQAAVGPDTPAPMTTGQGHHAGPRDPGSRLLGEDAATGDKGVPAPDTRIN